MEKSGSTEKNSTVLPFASLYQDDYLVPESYFDALTPNRKQSVELYLNRFSMSRRDAANIMAKDFHDEDRPLASTVALIPVAAHQEAPTIANAVRQYAQQETDSPFSVLMYLNAPNKAPDQAIEATLEEIEKAKAAWPELDLRVSEVDRFDEITIGEIRRSLWDAAVLLSHYEGRFDDPSADVIGINNDIDVHRLSPRYVRYIQEYVQRRQAKYDEINESSAPMTPMTTLIKHATDPTRPNLSKAIFWKDFAYRQIRNSESYEAGIVIPFSHYVAAGGFDPALKLHETQPLIKDLKLRMIRRTILETSPRRLVDRLQANALSDVWAKGSFGASDQCRTQTGVKDITHERKEELIFNSLDTSIPYFFYNTIDTFQDGIHIDGGFMEKSPNQKTVMRLAKELQSKKRIALYALERVIQSPLLAEIVDTSYDTDTMAQELSSGKFPAVLLQ